MPGRLHQGRTLARQGVARRWRGAWAATAGLLVGE